MRKNIAGIALALVATAALAGSQENVDALVVAIENAGCVMTNENRADILAASRLTEEEAFDAEQTLYAEGLAVLEPNGSMSLQTGTCSAS